MLEAKLGIFYILANPANDNLGLWILVCVPLIVFVLVWAIDSIPSPKYGAASKADFKHWEEYNKNHKKYTELAESKEDEFFNESLKTINNRDNESEWGKYRHAYRRASALMDIHYDEGDAETVIVYYILCKIFLTCYDVRAPTTLYGKQRLQFSPDIMERYYKVEDPSFWERHFKEEEDQTEIERDAKPLACIYIGHDKESGFSYVGQTMNAPEKRWREHRKEGTGPYKAGCKYPRWDVIKGEVPVDELDYWEAFYIGYHNSYECGFNENRGNDWAAYCKGVAEQNSAS